MAEAWMEEDEEELRDLRESGNRRNRRGHMNPATDRSERNKPDQRLPRRPEIRILAVEPLGPGTWFPGGPGGCAGSAALGFPPPAHSQGLWGGSIPASAQPPPSYDQVIREITHEQVPTTATNAPPRPSAVTISTQTDFDEAAESSASGIDVISQAAQSESVPAAVRRPLKPPRPSVLPSTIKPESPLILRESPLIPSEPLLDPNEHLLVPESSIVPSECPAVHTNTVSQPLSVPTESSAVPTESAAVPTESAVVPVEPVLVLEPAAKESVIIRRPVPRPRSMINLKPQAKEAQVEVLVELKEDDDENSKVLPNSIEQSTATYLQELLEAFYPEDQSYTDSMNTSGSQRNIRARIQAFESQSSTDISDGELSKKPEIPLRTLAQKPPVTACKPSLAPKPANRGSGEWDTLTESKPDLAVKNGPVFVLPKLQGTQVPFGAPNDTDCQAPPPLPAYGPVGGFTGSKPKKPPIASRAAGLLFVNCASCAFRPKEAKVLPIRPPPAKGGPKRPPPPKVSAQPPFLSHSSSVAGLHTAGSKRPQSMVLPKKGPVLPSRPGPGHPLYNNYTLAVPHGIAECDYMSRTPGELSFQKNEVLVLLQQIDSNSYECQGGDEKGKVLKSRMKIITPLNMDTGYIGPLKKSFSFGRLDGDGRGLRGRVLHDFAAEHPDELMLRAGDTVTQLEKVDAAWYHGTCRGRSGIFPVDFIEVDVPAATNGKKASPPPASISGPRCVARFDFEGEHADEMTFFEGDVIKLKELVGQEWARGEMNGQTGIFPLNFVEIVEGLPPLTQQQLCHNKPSISASSVGLSVLFICLCTSVHLFKVTGVNVLENGIFSRVSIWCEAFYDFAGQTNEDLSFFKGDRILITEKVDSDWYRGRSDWKEGIFPAIFVEGPAETVVGVNPQLGGSKKGKAKALFDFVSESEEELSFRTGDVITALESIDAEWFCGELHGKCGLFPKNYVQVLQEP
ncbi:SH3 domain-containing protein 19 [Acipenser ruthenus]|uniref:Osteoclast-stimulating factor 1 n=1 Tax=Acipenser ruthenus TaxID=7906 RepID=A0A444UGK8_ACIRT|nr:SH3 domain-containing protein 19 [Acipenser ruthenus]